MNKKALLAAVAAFIVSNPVMAASAQESELALVRNTVENLLNAMVEQGLLTREAAEQLITDAEAKAEAEVAALEEEQAVQPGDVRVTYVPETVVDQISAEVSADVSDEVATKVIDQAREDGWGVPGAMPSWLMNGKFFGDVRLQATPITFSDENEPLQYLDYQAINDNGGVAGLAATDRFLNTTEDTIKYQLRFRFGGRFDPSDNVTLGFRIATDSGNPISRNVTMGSSGDAGFGLIVDEAYVNLHTSASRARHHWNFWAGRVPNTFESSSLIFDDDLRLDGAVLGYDQLNMPGRGARGLFLRAGAFPLQSVDARSKEFGVKDKWLYGGQLGYEFGLSRFDARLSFAAAYYKFDNVAGVADTTTPNDPDTPSQFTDESIPDYIRKGNTVFNVRNVGPTSGRQIFGLASDFELVNMNVRLVKEFRPNFEVELYADYVKNVGFDSDKIFARTGRVVGKQDEGKRIEGRVGASRLQKFMDWNVFAGWSSLHRDAVIDAFSESDFHAGGTDHKGYYLGGNLGIAENTWMRGRYLSFDEISGPRLGIDIFQLSLNTRF